ncbi:MAG: phosphoglycolate phosphatase-like HAD superfamily hydrolase [Paraglaciecola sp.]|jgi:phosphoglycolate phosphatase-like HAD superfamily hydrolase
MKKTFLIFDIDGTLLYSNKIDSQCFAETYQKIYNIPFPTIDWTKFPHVTDDTIFKTAYRNHFQKEVEQAEMEDFKEAFVSLLNERRNESPEEFKEIPFSKITVDKLLEDDNFEIGIGTGGWLKPAMVKLSHVGIPHERLQMGTADGNLTREDIVKEVLGKAQKQFSFDEVVYVGDARWDVKTTRNLNMKFIGIRRNGDHDALLKLGATQVLSNFSNYDKFLLAIKNAAPPKHL